MHQNEKTKKFIIIVEDFNTSLSEIEAHLKSQYSIEDLNTFNQLDLVVIYDTTSPNFKLHSL
jgi:hypothetical protein